ncbi:MAG: rod shape-determining protein MreD [Myxococcota bacterium]
MSARLLLVMLPVGWLILVLQSTLVSYITYAFPQPELLFIILAHHAIVRRDQDGLGLACAYGYLMDLFSGRALGTHLFKYAVLMVVAQALGGRLLLQARFIQLLFVGALSLLGELLVLVALYIGAASVPELPTAQGLMSRVLANAVGTLFLFPLLQGLENALFARRRLLL